MPATEYFQGAFGQNVIRSAVEGDRGQPGGAMLRFGVLRADLSSRHDETSEVPNVSAAIDFAATDTGGRPRHMLSECTAKESTRPKGIRSRTLNAGENVTAGRENLPTSAV